MPYLYIHGDAADDLPASPFLAHSTMTQTIRSLAASLPPTTTSEGFRLVVGAEAQVSTRPMECQVFNFEDHAAPEESVPKNHVSVDDLAKLWEGDDKGKRALEEGRAWVADAFYGEDGVTVRSMRLRMGWSQARLAESLDTSQSHVARIERGSENLTIDTCRRLCVSLGVDMNTLNAALRRQEALLHAKGR